MTTLLYKNNAATTLQSGISASSLTVVLATGTGALFPNPTGGQAFYMTFLDASTKLVNEIVQVTSRSGDALTIVRGQQGTTALTWAAGDIATQLWTMGDAALMVQPDQLQSNLYGSALASGTGNSLTATLPSGLTALPDMMEFTLEALAVNTGAATLTLTLGTTTLASHPIKKFGGSALNAGDIPATGYPIQLTWSATLAAYIMTNPASGTTGSIAGGVANNVLYQTAPGTTGFVPAPTIAGQVLAFAGGILQWIAAAVTSFNGRSGAVVPQTGDYTAAQVGAVPVTAFQGGNVLLAPGDSFSILPSGMIIQAGTFNVTPNSATNHSYAKTFPNRCVGLSVSGNNQSAALSVVNLNNASFNVTVNANQVTYVAIGY